MTPQIRMKTLPKKALVIKPSSLGDVVQSLSFLGAVRDAFPLTRIDWVIAEGLEGILEGHPMISRLRVIRKDRWKDLRTIGSTVSELSKLSRDLAAERYDLVVDLQGLLRSGLLSLATRSAMRIGFAEAREGSALFYTHRVEGGRDVHAVDRYMRVARALGADTGIVNFPLPLVKASPCVEELPARLGPYAVIVPGARWESKKWPAERFGELTARLPLPSVVVGGGADEGIGRRIAALSRGRAVALTGRTTLKDLVVLMRRASFVVSNDSGPMHVAAATGVPVVALFGPTNPVRTGPYGAGHRVLRAEAPCAPCYKRECRNPRCMTGISVDEVCRTVAALPKEGQ